MPREEQRAAVKEETLLVAHAEVDRLVTGLLALLKKVEVSLSKVLIKCFQDTIVKTALGETGRFNRPMRQLVRRFDMVILIAACTPSISTHAMASAPLRSPSV